MNLSVIIIAKNEESLIHDAIASAQFAEEVIVVDSGSTDKTSEIAKKMHCKVYKKETKDFAKLRNAGLQKSTKDWVFYLDADERITPELRKKIEEVLENTFSDFACYSVLRRNFYYGVNEWPYKEKLERFFKKSHLLAWKGELHESPIYNGNRGYLSCFIDHFSHRNITEMLNKTNEWSDIEARLRFETFHPPMKWWRFFRVMTTAFYESYIRQQGWRVGTVGIIESIYQAFSIFITYAKLWELQQKSKNEKK